MSNFFIEHLSWLLLSLYVDKSQIICFEDFVQCSSNTETSQIICNVNQIDLLLYEGSTAYERVITLKFDVEFYTLKMNE